MDKKDPRYENYLNIVQEELIPAMGCTEPVSIALAAAWARKTLGCCPERVLIEVSGNIIKNVKSVVVPNTGGLKGIKAAAAVGIVAGKADKKLEVIAGIADAQKKAAKAFLEKTPMDVKVAKTGKIFDINITVFAGSSSARVRITDSHTNISLIEKDGKPVFEQNSSQEPEETDRSLLTIAGALDFAESVALEDVRSTIERQIAYNSAISAEGLKNDYGANIGKVLIKNYGSGIQIRAKAAAAAGSDARMSGCEMPVIIVSGSGNQGMATSLPVIEYAKELGVGHEKLIRALVLANLITIHLKTGIGRLSAYCGVVSAGAAAGAGIAYLDGGGLEEISHTIVNALAIVSGIVCDGAKASCAAKIAASVEAGIMGYTMFKNGQQFYGGDGIIAHGLEETIRNISYLGKEGMRKTDEEIIQLMLEA
ncbi:L-serine ammonia-lyase, iron-sulfur-dependent, subunit alpha [Treponema sp. TIM-1]|uniref:L-cysteine desulfidase family protein n=1 Tax=Treponema sp. TIM-1 TaxID=2898417 RepID=UPI00397F70E3